MDDTLVTKTSIQNLNLEFEGSRATKSNDEKFILNLQKLHVQRFFLKPEGRNALRKGLILYYKTNGISILKKHVDAEHGLLAKNLMRK
jgi:hypothetical protein